MNLFFEILLLILVIIWFASLRCQGFFLFFRTIRRDRKQLYLGLMALILLLASVFILIGQSHAQDDSSLPAITVINLIRGNGLGHETDDLYASLKAQWQVTSEAGVHATWLFQYGALENIDMTKLAKQEMKGQEYGLLFEIDRNFAEKAKIQFRGQGAWYRSDGLFLNSYDQAERHKLIDAAFSKFKDTFGYYPKTVGAWWIGGDSLYYMQKKYGISSSLKAADQFNLDFYSIWGTPLNIPYISSKNNEGIPAATFDTSSKVVILQWALRDPLRGYYDPTYSLQDYTMKGYSTDYVDYLSSIFLEKPYSNMVIGLENGGTLQDFQRYYKSMLLKAREYEKNNKAKIVLAKEFAQSFLRQKKVLADGSYFLTSDYKSSDQSFWYTSVYFRATIQKIKDVVYLVDLRDYSIKSQEDYDVVPNSSPTLRINEASLIDSMRSPDSRINIASTEEPLRLKISNHNIMLYAGNTKIAYFTPKTMTLYRGNKETNFNFVNEKFNLSPLLLLIVFYVLYLFIMFLKTKSIRIIMKEFFILLFPALLACTYFISQPVYLFDKKEIIILKLLFSLRFLPIIPAIYISKILPFIALMTTHFLLILRSQKNITKYYYYTLYILIILLYAHIPYFPLDKSTYVIVVISLSCIAVLLFTLSIYILGKLRSRFILVKAGILSIIVLSLFSIIVVFSRSKIALTNYEIEALSIMKLEHKNIIFVGQSDYSNKLIYKAVKPILYAESKIGESITGTTWQFVARPETYVLKIKNYENKLIVIPRYLGTNITDYEIDTLGLKLIYDDTQIAILKKSR